MADIVDLVEHSPLDRSPGLDGLPFEVYKHLIPRSPRFRHLLLLVIRQALKVSFRPHGVTHAWFCFLRKETLSCYATGDRFH